MNYTQMSDYQLDKFIAQLERQCTEDSYEPEELQGAKEESDLRAEALNDPRVAQALGRAVDNFSS